MKNKNLFIVCAIASMVPWGMILKLLGLEFQIIGIIIQLLGLGIMVLKRKQIFYL